MRFIVDLSAAATAEDFSWPSLATVPELMTKLTKEKTDLRVAAARREGANERSLVKPCKSVALLLAPFKRRRPYGGVAYALSLSVSVHPADPGVCQHSCPMIHAEFCFNMMAAIRRNSGLLFFLSVKA